MWLVDAREDGLAGTLTSALVQAKSEKNFTSWPSCDGPLDELVPRHMIFHHVLQGCS